MTRRPRPARTLRAPSPGAAEAAGSDPRPLRRERGWVAALLALHTALALVVALGHSVTFDENFHVPAGVLYLERGYTHVSVAQPPLARAALALPVVAARPALPSDSILGLNAERAAGESFMRLNADRFHALMVRARLMAVLLSLAAAVLVWRVARAQFGARAGIAALALWTLLPETIAHAGIAGMDLPTALVTFAATVAFVRFATTGAWRAWAPAAALTGLAVATRFSALQLAPLFVLLLLAGHAAGALGRPRRAWLGLVLLLPAALLVLAAAYRFEITWAPLAARQFQSDLLRQAQVAAPWFRPPLPEGWLVGLEYLSRLTETVKPVFALGRTFDGTPWWYFPFAIVVKWPLGLLALLALGAAGLARRRGWRDAWLLLPPAVILAVAMGSDLGYGVRYLLPMLPFLCVWAAGAFAPGAPRWAPRVAMALVALVALETATAMPWPLSHFNPLARGHGERLLNDSNVDWGQGLIALRRELDRRGIATVHLAYHGTTDPALYGIRSIPYLGGQPGPESDWIAVSSYWFVGLGARMMTPSGPTEVLALDFRPLWARVPDATVGGSIHLFRLR